MKKTLLLIMAKTIAASACGLHRVDRARRKKMWTKSEKAWAELVPTSVATLRRFWAGLAIQVDTFQAICETVGIKDWESVADFEKAYGTEPTSDVAKSIPLKAYGCRLSFAIAGSIDEIDKKKLDAIVALLQRLGGDTTIEILDIDEGSIRLILGGSPIALEKIEALFRSGKLTKLCGTSVQDVHIVDKNELCQLILKNGGSGLNFNFENLRGADLSGADLSGAELVGANLRDANLSGANLSGANLWDATLWMANLHGTNLSGASLWGASLRGTNLRMANLSDANLGGASLSDANLGDANLSDANLDGVFLRRADLSGANLSRANLFNAAITGTDLSNANLSNANLIHADLSNANLSNANLSNTNLSNADLSGANLIHADLSNADLSGANLIHAVMTGTAFRGTNLNRTRFGNNVGLTESDKSTLKKRGGILELL
jgi:uncharacterized protein YjbI with pentapeptide repeats